MGQTPSIPTTEQPSLILTFPQELFAIIMSFKDQSFELVLATTCKILYERYELYYEKQTVVVLYDPKNEFSSYANTIKALQLRNGWIRLKFTTILDSQSSNCPVKILCLNGLLQVPKELNCACIDALIISLSREKFMLTTISFIGEFSNLKSLRLEYTILNNDGISMVSKLSLLEFISLYICEMANGHLLKIFERHTTLKEIQLLWCNFPYATSIKLPSQLKRFEIEHPNAVVLDASLCTQLEYL